MFLPLPVQPRNNLLCVWVEPRKRAGAVRHTDDPSIGQLCFKVQVVFFFFFFFLFFFFSFNFVFPLLSGRSRSQLAQQARRSDEPLGTSSSSPLGHVELRRGVDARFWRDMEWGEGHEQTGDPEHFLVN